MSAAICTFAFFNLPDPGRLNFLIRIHSAIALGICPLNSEIARGCVDAARLLTLLMRRNLRRIGISQRNPFRNLLVALQVRQLGAMQILGDLPEPRIDVADLACGGAETAFRYAGAARNSGRSPATIIFLIRQANPFSDLLLALQLRQIGTM
jgi:hypothetical protein